MAFAIVFDGVGAGEWLVLLAVLLVVMGPKRLPSVIRSIGNHYAKFRRAAESFKRQIMEMDSEFDRAVDSAAREAEEAAKIPDAAEAPSYPDYGYDDPESFEHPDDPAASDDPASADVPAASDDPAPSADPAMADVQAPAEEDGNRPDIES